MQLHCAGDALLPFPGLRREIRSFGGVLSPVTFWAQGPSTGELLRTLSRMAASKPTSQLSEEPHFLSHLARAQGP